MWTKVFSVEFLIKGIVCMLRPYLSLVLRNLIGLIVYNGLEA